MAELDVERTWLDTLYREVLGRAPDEAGLGYWAEELRSGRQTREQVETMLNRSEPDRFVQSLYSDMLGRQATQAEVDYWAADLTSGRATREQIRGLIGASPESLTRPNTLNAPPTAAPAPTGPPPEQTSAFAQVRETLNEYGLGSLSDWAWQEIVNGATPTQVSLDLMERPEFVQRFPAIEARRAAGLPPISPAEYVAYEQQARQMMRNAGLPTGFFDDNGDVTKLISGDVSLAELSQRISDEGFARVARAPAAVRDAFAEFFGVQGDAALAALFLDPERSRPILERMATTADIAGRARDAGLALGFGRSDELAGYGLAGAQVGQAAAGVAANAGLFAETVSENTDLTAEGTGLDAALGLSGTAQRALERRGQERVAAFSGRGGAATTQEGVVGLGVEP